MRSSHRLSPHHDGAEAVTEQRQRAKSVRSGEPLAAHSRARRRAPRGFEWTQLRRLVVGEAVKPLNKNDAARRRLDPQRARAASSRRPERAGHTGHVRRLLTQSVASRSSRVARTGDVVPWRARRTPTFSVDVCRNDQIDRARPAGSLDLWLSLNPRSWFQPGLHQHRLPPRRNGL